MDQKELDLWRMVDVGWYASTTSIFLYDLEIILKRIQEDKMNIQELWNSVKSCYEKISRRFQEMDLDLLNDNFPIDILRELKNSVFPEMGKRYGELENLLTQYVLNQSNGNNQSIQKKIEECQNLVKRMDVLGKEFKRNERYGEYRSKNPERIYLK